MTAEEELKKYKRAWKMALALEKAKEMLLVAHRLGSHYTADRALTRMENLGVETLSDIAVRCGIGEKP